MRILNVQPKDIHVQLEMSISQLNCVLEYMERCTFDPMKYPDDVMKENDINYVENNFIQELNALTEDVKGKM